MTDGSRSAHPQAYVRALDALASALKFGINPSLEGIRRITDELGRPQDALRAVQVTGTNGKSSVTRLVAALLAAHGCRTAAYTSPHLVEYRERVEIDGLPAPAETFGEAVLAAVEAAGRVGGEFTEFELLTAAALWLMREQGVEWACLEVGLGGRWDATSVVSPAVAVVTGVGLDHVDRLGGTIEAIASDKAHIIKPGSVAVLGPATVAVRDVFLERAEGLGVPVIEVGEGAVTFELLAPPTRLGEPVRFTVRTPLAMYEDLAIVAPSYQVPNVAVAIAAAEAALAGPLDDALLGDALRVMRFPGRFELLADDPPLVIDGAHNPQAASALARAIREAFPGEPPTIVLGILADKDAEGIVRELGDAGSAFIATAPDSPRALPAADVARLVTEATGRPCETIDSVSEAVAAARAKAHSGVVVTGSLYTVGEVRAAFRPLDA